LIAIPSYHELKHAKVLLAKQRPDYQNKLAFLFIDDRLLELMEKIPLLQQPGAPCSFEDTLERTRKIAFTCFGRSRAFVPLSFFPLIANTPGIAARRAVAA
jgi:hypothetical protein